MTPQEKDLITALLGRLGQAAGQAKDAEADQLIHQAMAAQPDAPYLLVQTVLIQDMALHQAQGRIAELERQLTESKAAQGAPADQPTSFLGGLFGHSASPATAPPAGSVPAAGPWSRPAPAPQYAQQQPYAQQPYAQQAYAGQAQPMMAPGMMGGGMMGGGMFGGGGFLRSAATTAAGIAGGALLFEGIQSMFGQHGGGMLSGSTMQPGISETVINNYYDNDPSSGGGAPQTTAWDQPAGVDPGVDYASANDPGYASDPGFAPDTDVASDTDFGGGDGGGGDDSA